MTSTVVSNGLLPGFADPVFDSQAVFRSLMSATSYAGRVFNLDRTIPAPAPLNEATAGLCLSLVDFETTLWIDFATSSSDAALSWLRFHCGAPIAESSRTARFAVVSNAVSMPPLFDFCLGETEYPDRSTTIVVQVPSLKDGTPTIWSGPGIKDNVNIAIAGLPDWFWTDWDLNSEVYPLGVDVFFTCGNTIVGLPRTTRVEA